MANRVALNLLMFIIGGVRDKSTPTVWIPHKQPMPLSSFYHITVRDLGGIIANTEKMRYNAQ